MTKFEETRLRNLLAKKEGLCLDRIESIMLKNLQEKKRSEEMVENGNTLAEKFKPNRAGRDRARD